MYVSWNVDNECTVAKYTYNIHYKHIIIGLLAVSVS